LNVSPDARVVLIRRLRLADGEPMALETLHVPAALVPGLTRERLEDASFYELLEHDYGVVIASGMQSIEPTVTNEEESELLGVPLHSPAFLFERTSRTASGETVEFVRSLYRGDRYRLVAELSQRRDRPVAAVPSLAAAAWRRAASTIRPIAPSARSGRMPRSRPARTTSSGTSRTGPCRSTWVSPIRIGGPACARSVSSCPDWTCHRV